MRKLLFLFFIITINANAQEISTISEIYSYDIGDEFHFELIDDIECPPQVTRFVVQNKYYSEQQDTVFYILSYNNYTTEYFSSPTPHLEYEFDAFIDTIYYTQLDSSFLFAYSNDTNYYSLDTISENMTNLCNVESIGYQVSYCGEDGWHCDVHEKKYAKGLGLVYWRDYYTGESSPNYSGKKLFYYKKNNERCGEPDLITNMNVNFIDKSSFTISPNPVNDYLRIQLKENLHINKISIYNSELQCCKMFGSNEDNQKIYLGDLNSGMYFLIIDISNQKIIEKIIKY